MTPSVMKNSGFRGSYAMLMPMHEERSRAECGSSSVAGVVLWFAAECDGFFEGDREKCCQAR